ncbi:XRE family transcriptional regulator|uniref:XRE family transcriptional regulator n=1 Tax=Brenneria salicis ATCC 15712 = DSM 30166 TaxID=714314 RepID=A0A366I462_9GAMM|nr:helix-turn-helix domain-containing protein [Brenneria salicis]NMN92676.1 XRE family transcriptional regulator [Brenneria salicis ATCC 15712 = DSM 30166]RBP62489.1 XRE family transcriptional regulator [Brenneria salicis ATCC 15712 = DSM 30166]RLM30587.1 transcriptional regulator [Brenneria salicis ATCC 15712 = DSM 30166]
MSIDEVIASQIYQLRKAKNMSIELLAHQSGVSKAMISKIERKASSPSATILGRLAAGLGVPITQLLSNDQQPRQRLRRKAEQETWRDPELHYLRRQVLEREAATGLEMIEIILPAFAKVSYPRWSSHPYQQRLWLIEGALTVEYHNERFALTPGDCLNFDVKHPVTFHNPDQSECRYLLVITNE